MTFKSVTLTLHQTKYSANATRSEKPDPHHLVVQDQAMAISVPGLMTINKRIP